MKKFIVILVVLLLLFSCGGSPPQPVKPLKPGTMRIGAYDYLLPSWWDTIKVDLPAKLDNENEFGEYVKSQCGSDTGTVETWQSALKLWALRDQAINAFPVYIGHCLAAGKQFVPAAQVFVELYGLLDETQKDRLFLSCYLPYEAGESYEKAGDKANALKWYDTASKVNSRDDATSYYRKESEDQAKALRVES